MTITSIKEIVEEIAPNYPVLSIELFGSYANEENTEDSDIDLLVYFDEKIANLFDLSVLKLDIQDRVNKKVDVIVGPIKKDSFLTIGRKIRIFTSNSYLPQPQSEN